LRSQPIDSENEVGYDDEDVYELEKNTLAKYHSSWPLGYDDEASRSTLQDDEKEVHLTLADASHPGSPKMNCSG
jgi:hypothetical protein